MVSVPYCPSRLVCRCAVATNNKGYVYFGIQFYGECWSSADAGDRFHIYGPNDKCVNTEYKSCDDQASGEACAGAGHANYVYEIVPGTYPETAWLPSTWENQNRRGR